MQEFEKNIDQAAEFLKGLANSHRLRILYQLAGGERKVGELIEATGIPQTSMSQHLNRLKREDIVRYRRDHKELYYSISSEMAIQIMAFLYEKYSVSLDDE